MVLGVLIWLTQQQWEDWQFRQVRIPNTKELQQLELRWRQQHGQALDETLRAAIQQQEIDERIMFREALRQKLHLRDPVVLRRLRQDAEFLGLAGLGPELIQYALDLRLYEGDAVIRRRILQRMRSAMTPEPEPVSEEQLRSLYAARDYQAESNTLYDFEHKFFRHDTKRPQAALQRAQEQLQLKEIAAGSADAFLHGQAFSGASEKRLKQHFGAEFLKQLSQLPLDSWQGPIASPYGQHLIRIHAKHTEGASFAQKRGRLQRQWQERHQQQGFAQAMQRLRQRYRLRS